MRGETARVYAPGDPVGMEAAGQSSLYKGGYKLVRNNAPFGDNVWRLYDVETDPGETRDLAAARPDLFAEMMADYEAYARRVGVLPVPEGYTTIGQLTRNYAGSAYRRFWWVGLAAAVLVAGALALVLRRRRARR